MRSRIPSLFWNGALAVALGAMALMGTQAAKAQDLKSFEQRITTKVLPNGLTIVICGRSESWLINRSASGRRRRFSAIPPLLMRAT